MTDVHIMQSTFSTLYTWNCTRKIEEENHRQSADALWDLYYCFSSDKLLTNRKVGLL